MNRQSIRRNQQSPEGNIYYNTNTGKLRIREESAWQVTSKQSITDRAEFKTLYGASTPSVNTIQNVFYNTDTKKLQYLKNDSWRTVAEEEVAGDTFNVGVDSYKFSLNNAVQPELNLYRGNEYVFNQSSADNSGQRLFVSNDLSGRNYSNGFNLLNSILQFKHTDFKEIRSIKDSDTSDDDSYWDAIDNDTSTGFVVSITPKYNTSKICISTNLHIGGYLSFANWWGARLYRKIGNGSWEHVSGAGGTDSGQGTACWLSANNLASDQYEIGNLGNSYLDTPNTTDITYYTIYWKSAMGNTNTIPHNSSNLYLNRAEDQSNAYRALPISTLTAEEICQENIYLAGGVTYNLLDNVIQIQHKDYKKTVIKNNSGWDDIDNDITNGFVVSITPSYSSSKIHISTNLHIGGYSDDVRWWGARLYRKIGSGGTWTYVSGAAGTDSGNGTYCWLVANNLTSNNMEIGNLGNSYLDSPNTIEIIYYTVYWKARLADADNDLLYLNRSEAQNHPDRSLPISTLTAKEICQENITIGNGNTYNMNNNILQLKHTDYTKISSIKDSDTSDDDSTWDAIDNNTSTGFIVDITPKYNTSNIRISTNLHIGGYLSNAIWWGARLYRKIGNGSWEHVSGAGGTDSGSGTACWLSANNLASDQYEIGNLGNSYLDTPNTTDITYYTIYWKSVLGNTNTIPHNSSNLYLNRAEGQSNAYRALPISTITAEEICKENVTIGTSLTSVNTAGVTSTGTLGTDLVSKWTIPTDASDTMYYASDGSANAGGKINITNVPAQEKTFAVDVSFDQTPVLLAGGNGGLKGTGGSEGTALASSQYDSTYGAIKAFNGTHIDYRDAWTIPSLPDEEEWVKFEFPYDVTITSYKMWERLGNHDYHPVGWKLHSFTASQPFDSTNYNINDTNTLIDTRTSSQNSDNGISMTIQYTPNSNSIANDDTFRLFNIPLANQKQGRTIVIFFPYPDSRGFRNNVDAVNLGEIAYYGKNHNNAPDIPAFTLGGLAQPTLNLYRDSVYKFDQSDPDNVGQRLFVSNDLSGRILSVVGNKLPDVAMTSNDTTDCEASVSSQNNEITAQAFKAFNHVIGDYWHSAINVYNRTTGYAETGGAYSSFQGIYGQWIKIWFKTKSFFLKELKVYPRAGSYGDNNLRAPDDGHVFGSLDGTTWTELLHFTAITNSGNYQSNVGKIINVSATTAFSYYVLLTTRLSGGGGGTSTVNIGEIEFYPWDSGMSSNTAGVTSTGTLGTDLITRWRVPTDASDTMYYASDGSANMGGTISITDAPTKTTRVTTIASSAGSNGGGDTYTKYAVDVSLNRFTIGGHMQPTLNLYKDSIYKFDQSDPDNVGQRLYVSNDVSGRKLGLVDSIIYEIPSNLTTTNYFNGSSTNVVLGSDVTFDWSKDWEIKTSFTINQSGPNHIYPRIFSFVSNLNHGASATHSEFDLMFDNNGKRIGLMIKDPYPFPSTQAEWISGLHEGTLVNDELLLNTRYNVLVKYVYSTGVITAGYQLHSNFTSWDDVIIQGTKFVDSSLTGNGGYGSPITFTGSITYQTQNSRIGDRSTNDRKFNGTIHSLTMTNRTTTTTTLTENTAGVTSTGTLGTDLVSTWRVPTDASDTMYYASDGSANAGGKINVEVTPYEEKTYAVDVSLNAFTLGGVAQPTLNLYRDSVYKFDQSDPDNIGQRLYVSNDLSGGGRGVVGNKLPDVAMTSNTMSDFVASASTELNGSSGFGAFRAFNHVIGNQDAWIGTLTGYTNGVANGNVKFTPMNIDGEWIKIEFKNTSKMIKEIRIYQRDHNSNDYQWRDRAPDEGHIYGSNDGSYWTELIHFTGLASSGGVSHYEDGVPKVITLNSTTAYSYFVMVTTKTSYVHNVSNSGDNNSLDIGEIELYPWDGGMSINTTGVTSTGTLGTDLVTRWRVPTDASDTMYYASDGSANAGGTINIFNNTNDTTTPTIECLTTSSAVNVISSGSNKYRFNGDTTYVANKYYGLGAGTFTFTGVPSGHPIAILNAGKTSLISYAGLEANKSSKTVSGTTSDGDYDFYHGDVTVTVSGDFGSVSVYCILHGYMGGENLLRYSSSCDVPSASGGIETQNSGYRIHAFTTSGVFTVYNNMDVEYLIIGGGGGGTDGDDLVGAGAGGGAGGFVELTNISITPASYTVIVGAGGSGSILNQSSEGQAGIASSFNGTTALGGGKAGAHGYSGGNGGSGGGEYRAYGVGSGDTLQGNDGGEALGNVGYGGGGGGGGAGAVGGDGASGTSIGGHGGDGKVSSITGTATYYAGGGGGGAQNQPGGSNNGRSDGGLGGGGKGGGDGNNSAYNSGLSGTDGLGGGGGGGSSGSGNNNLGAGDGGDGVVIIRYLL